MSGKKYTSDIGTDMAKEYMFESYRYLKKENSPVYGVDNANDVVVKPIYFDNLCYLLHAEGTHLILFGGTWSELTQGVIDRINYYAKKYGVDTVYTFDFRLDGETEDCDIKVDITAQDTYEGPDKKETVGVATSNFIYGELVTRHLKNLNDWVQDKVGTENDITWINLTQNKVTVPNLREPFLFVFNKKNTVDNSGAGVEREYYPIVSAMEISSFRGEDGKMYKDAECTIPDDDFDERLEETIFKKIGPEGVSRYNDADYMYDAFRMNERGHAYKTEDCFKKDEQINIQPICLAQLRWMLAQNGAYIIVFAGPWCANSQAGVPTINDYAVANNVRVYMFDMRIEGKHQIDFWLYPRQNEIKMTHPSMLKYDIEIFEKRLAKIPVLVSLGSDKAWVKEVTLTVDYVDDEGVKHSILPIDMPYLVACDTTAINTSGKPKPVLAAHNHGGIELINCLSSFVYSKPRYKLYTAGVYYVFSAYCTDVGKEVKDITIDRTAPIVPGKPIEHPEYQPYAGPGDDTCALDDTCAIDDTCVLEEEIVPEKPVADDMDIFKDLF